MMDPVLLFTIHIMGIITGLVGAYAVLLTFFKKEIPFRFSGWMSFVAFAGFGVAWLAGCFFKYLHNLAEVPPTTLATSFPGWNNFFTQAECAFFLPPLFSFGILLAFSFFEERIKNNPNFKKLLMTLLMFLVLFGIVLLLGSFLTTGSLKQL